MANNDQNNNEGAPEQNDIVLAAMAASAEDPARHTRRWLLQTRSATLCTTAARAGLEGYPFGSVVPFALDANGRPLIFIADIAAHTANLKQDARATLFVSDPGADGDPQTTWRIGVMGKMERLCTAPRSDGTPHVVVDAEVLADVHARYTERVPAANDYAQTHGFAYWRMSHVERIRYIAGFGKICWIAGKDILRTGDSAFSSAADAAAAHMNEDHAENMREMVDGLRNVNVESASMGTLERTGFTLHTVGPEHRFFFSFGDEIDADAIRPSIIGVLKTARAAITERA